MTPLKKSEKTNLSNSHFITTKHIKYFLFFAVSFLILAHLIGRIFFNVDDENGLFNLDVENNVPTYFTSIMLLGCSILMILIVIKTWKNKNLFTLNWIFLAGIFIFLAIDELRSIHEQWMSPIRDTFNTSGLLYFAWIIPYGIFLIFLFFINIKFLKHLPKSIRRRFIISGFLYILGGIVIEAFGGQYIEAKDWEKDNIYFTIITFEESFEIIGVSYFFHTLFFTHIKKSF